MAIVNALTDRVLSSKRTKSLQRHKDKYKIISTRLFSGKIKIHVYDKQKPAQDFVETEPDLKDVYFSTIQMSASGHREV